MDHEIDMWLDMFAAGAATAYPWELTPRGWLRTRSIPAHGLVCPLLAQWRLDTGSGLALCCNSWAAGELQDLSAQACGAIFRAADRNPTGYDPILRARLLALCHVEESSSCP